MNLDLTTNEYRDLLDLLHISDVVLSGHRREEDPRSKRHRALIQKLYALASGEGLGNLVRYDENAKTYTPTEAFEESTQAHVLINEFEDHLFWDELIARLSVRDAAQQAGGLDRFNAMSDSDRQAAEGPVRQRYIEEFSNNGIANLSVVEVFSSGVRAGVRTSD